MHPVNSEKVPGYTDVVKRPMDFGTMSHKVNKGKYRSLEDFAVRPPTCIFCARKPIMPHHLERCQISDYQRQIIQPSRKHLLH